jgi:hypothetical protein
MSTLAGDAPSAPEAAHEGATAAGNGPSDGPETAPERTCEKCGSPLEPTQDWCLSCGAPAPGALGKPRWRSTGVVLTVLAALALAAAATAVAALNQSPPPRHVVVLAETAGPVVTPPATSTTPPATTAPPATTTQPTPAPSSKQAPLPKIPLTASTPTTTTPATTTPSSSKKGSSGSSSPTETGSGSEGSSSTPTALVLDTNAATTYNPYGYPTSYFGDPSLTIDGDHLTIWTAQVDPNNAPLMAEGVLIDLKSPKRLSALQLISPTKGMLVQVYGTTASKAPSSITASAWTPLTAPHVLSKTSTHFKLKNSTQAFRFVTVWISRAPSSSTPTAPGHVSIGEIELFPAS